MAGTVPDDVTLGILAKLCLKSLFRFKSVSKTWYSTISDPQFSTNLHRKPPSALICQDSKTFSAITIESLLTASPTTLSLPWETEAPRHGDMNENHLIGSCNGLVCVDHKSGETGLHDFIVWSPSTGKFRILPRCSRIRKQWYYYKHYVGFGYDESVDDYKLVWIDYRHEYLACIETEYEVFSLKSNAWRRARTYDCYWSPRINEVLSRSRVDDSGDPRIVGVFSNGAIHWRVTLMNSRQIVVPALDLATERFRVFDSASYPSDPQGGGSCLVGGCSCRYDAGTAAMNLKMMKEHGSRDSVTCTEVELIPMELLKIRIEEGLYQL